MTDGRDRRARTGPAADGEEGEGLFSTLFGLLLFLLFVLFAVQVSTHLYATTVVTTAAYDAVRLAAAGAPDAGAVPGAPPGAPDVPCLPPDPGRVSRADAHLVGLLGGLWSPGATSWAVSSDAVAVTVVVPTPARVVGGVGALVGLDRIERTVALPRECFR